jgi:hypothetical protein
VLADRSPEPAFGAMGVGSWTSGCTVPGAPLGIVFLPLGDAGVETGLGVGFGCAPSTPGETSDALVKLHACVSGVRGDDHEEWSCATTGVWVLLSRGECDLGREARVAVALHGV